jgi:hypothetical protein
MTDSQQINNDSGQLQKLTGQNGMSDIDCKRVAVWIGLLWIGGRAERAGPSAVNERVACQNRSGTQTFLPTL